GRRPAAAPRPAADDRETAGLSDPGRTHSHGGDGAARGDAAGGAPDTVRARLSRLPAAGVPRRTGLAGGPGGGSFAAFPALRRAAGRMAGAAAAARRGPRPEPCRARRGAAGGT